MSNDALEQIVQLVTNDNLDLGCAAIEQAATEKVCARYKIPLFISVPALGVERSVGTSLRDSSFLSLFFFL